MAALHQCVALVAEQPVESSCLVAAVACHALPAAAAAAAAAHALPVAAAYAFAAAHDAVEPVVATPAVVADDQEPVGAAEGAVAQADEHDGLAKVEELVVVVAVEGVAESVEEGDVALVVVVAPGPPLVPSCAVDLVPTCWFRRNNLDLSLEGSNDSRHRCCATCCLEVSCTNGDLPL
jgi:hypothetical protein